MRRSRRTIAAAVLIGGGLATVAAGGGAPVGAQLEGAQEVPPVTTDGSGTFEALIKVARGTITYELSYSDLNGPVQQAHIHVAPRGENGGVAVFLCTNLGNGPAGTPTCPPEGGTVTGTLTADDIVGQVESMHELRKAIRQGNTYVNVHTDPHPGGEIRGQISNGLAHQH